MLLVVGLSLLASSLLCVHTCSYKPPPRESIRYAITEYPKIENKNRSKREVSSWDWIRIETDYDVSVNNLTDDEQDMLQYLITNACEYFEKTLKVQRLNSLLLESGCNGNWKLKNGILECEQDCQRKCGVATFSANSNFFSKCTCKTGTCPTKFSEESEPLRTADFVLLVSAIADKCQETTLAYAGHCSVDKHTKRPVAGYVNICPNSFKNMKASDQSQWEATIKHELIHAFVFSTSLFSDFKAAKENKTSGGTGPITEIPNVVKRITRHDWECANGTTPHDVYMIVTPKVVNEARHFFNCSDLEGAEIENQGGSGSAGCHWEKRIFENEAMSGVATQVYAISRLTLALFEDSGWYQVDYDNAEHMLWGYQLGCDFAKRSCLSWIRKNRNSPYPFCNVMHDTRCSTTRKAKVRCNLVTERPKNFEKDYNYNIDELFTDKKRNPIRFGSGQIEMADYCPYYRVYGEFSSVDKGADTRCTFPDNMNYNNYSLEIFSPTARCFQLNGGIRVSRESGAEVWMHSVGCYENICKDNRLWIKTQNSRFYPCYYAGQLIHVEKRVHGIGTIRTQIVCAPCAELCGTGFCAPDKIISERIGDPYRNTAISSSACILLLVFTVGFHMLP